MEPMTQSAQISSSQGFADGHNSAAAKESKLSDKRVALGSDMNSESVTTSLRFPSQPASSPPGNNGQSDEQPDSPIKTSPVSERIKALEALAAQKKEPDFRSDGFSHHRERHADKRSSIEVQKAAFEKNEKTSVPTVQKQGSSVDKESPESPFEVLGDFKQLNEFEETEEWMKAHLPPVPDMHSVDIIKGPSASENAASKQEKETDILLPDAPTTFTGVPDAFMDSPCKAPILQDDSSVPQNPYAVEESDFDLSFLPTAYMWNQQEKNDDAVIPVSPAPPVCFGSTSPASSPKHTVEEGKPQLTGVPDPPETIEADSSGESDDTVIEDGVPIPASVTVVSPVSENVTSASSSPNLSNDNKETPSAKSDRKLIQVPTINVIETDEPNYSEEEMDLEAEEVQDYEDKVKDQEVKTLEKTNTESGIIEIAKEQSLQNEFMERYSPPSSPVDSDVEYSPKHKAQGPLSEADHQESALKQEPLPNPTSDDSHMQSEDFHNTLKEEAVKDFSDNDDEWGDHPMDIGQPISTIPDPAPSTVPKVAEQTSTGGTEAPLEAYISKSSFMQDDIYDRVSFDYDYDAPPSPVDDGDDSEPELAIDRPYTNPFLTHNEQSSAQINAPIEDKDTFTPYNDNDAFVNQNTFSKVYPQDPYSSIHSAPVNTKEPDVDNETTNLNVDDNSNSIKGHTIDTQQHTKTVEFISEIKNDPEALGLDSESEPADSFVEFMRECLKSQQDEETIQAELCVASKKTEYFHSSPTVVMDLEQEKLTINALKELGSSQEEDMDTPLQFADQNKVEPSPVSTQQSTCTSNPQPPCSQTSPVLDSTYANEVEAIDEWVAEAYHLAEHVLTAVLTHLSVKDLIHWRDPKKSGVVFGVSMLVLLSLAAFSVISVVSYLLLALLCVTITFRIYKSVIQAVQKSSDGHPFKTLIEKDVSIPPETFRKHVDASLTYINRALKQLSRLFLVEDLVDSLKLAVVMWLLTYVGAVFNGITILILADILLFAVPPIYEKNKTKIDQYIDLVRNQVNSTMAKLQEKLPGAVKRIKTE